MFSIFKGALALVIASYAAGVVAQADFTGAQWIWTSPGPVNLNYPIGNASFRRDYFPPSGKTPLSANILITADNGYTLYVNGNQIGSGHNFHTSERYCVRLTPECNVFAVEGVNDDVVPNPAGILAVIRIRYTDGFVDTIVTDGEWHAIAGTPAGFQQVAFDDSAWPAAFPQGAWPNAAPWNDPSLAPAPAISPLNSNTGLSFQSASFIWTNEGTPNTPPGARAFRKTISLSNGQFADSATIDIAADNQYTLYVNGLLVGSGPCFSTAQRYQVNFPPTSKVVIAVYGVNSPSPSVANPAGIIAAIELPSCDCGDSTYVVTDSSWKYSLTVPNNFYTVGFDDSNWPNAVDEGSLPEGKPPSPTTHSPQSGPLPGAPSAPPATVV